MYLTKIATSDYAANTLSGCRTCAARACGLCASLGDRELAQLRQRSAVRRLQPDAALVHHGDPVKEVVTVVKGVLRLSHLLPDGRRQIASFAFPGDFLGIGFEDEHFFTIEAVTAADLCVTSKSDFACFVREHPSVATPLYAAAAHQLAEAREHVVLLGRKTAQERLATFILQMADRTEQQPGSPLRAVLPMSRTDIADHLGLRIETVCRELAILKAGNLVTLNGTQELFINDPNGLKDRAGDGMGDIWRQSLPI